MFSFYERRINYLKNNETKPGLRRLGRLSSRDALGGESCSHWEIFDERIAMKSTLPGLQPTSASPVSKAPTLTKLFGVFRFTITRKSVLTVQFAICPITDVSAISPSLAASIPASQSASGNHIAR
jgi:hypothetical protein